MSLKLRKEKKTPKRIFLFLLSFITFRAAPPGGRISVLGAKHSHPREWPESFAALVFDVNAGASFSGREGGVDGHCHVFDFHNPWVQRSHLDG